MKVSSTCTILAVVVSALLSPVVVQGTNYTDVDILNFALNLECLEAEYYSWQAYGVGLASIDSSLVGTGSNLTTSSSGGAAGVFTDDAAALAIATEIAENEIAHVRYLRAALGSAAVPCPFVDVSPTKFNAAASAAVTNAISGGTLDSGTPFNPYAAGPTGAVAAPFYLGAFIFEDVGVTAYKGAVANLQSGAYAAVAAGIMAVEAGHAAIIRNALYNLDPSASTPVDSGLTYTKGSTAGTAISIQSAVDAVSGLRDSVASTSAENGLTRVVTAPTGDVNTVASPGPDLFAANTTTAVAFTRTPTQVLDIVYLGSSAKPGGFLPQGITGNSDVLQITTSSVKTCSSGAFAMATMSVASLAVVAVAAAFAL